MQVQSNARDETEVTVLFWNVWNLPSWLTDNASKTRAKQISPLLNDYDVVVLNEAFVNHKSLLAQVTHKYRYIPPKPFWTIFSSGLMFLSKYEITNAQIETYSRRSGVDFFAAKGIAQVLLTLKRDGQDFGHLCIFATHMQASHGSCAQRARREQALQAAKFIRRDLTASPEPRSDVPTILVGDFNMGPRLESHERYSQHYHDDEDHLERTNAYHILSSHSGLNDISQFLDPSRDEFEYSREICRVIGNESALQQHSLAYELQDYTDGGNRLSDTKALCLRLRVSAL